MPEAALSPAAPQAAPPPAPPRRAGERAADVARRLVNSQPGVLLAVIVALALLLQADNPVFLSHDNVITLLRSAVTTFVIGCAATVVFTSGGLDLSVGSYFNIGGIVVALLMVHGVAWPLAVLIGLLAGAALGLVNAALIVVARIPPIIATLATFYAVGGLSIIVTDGASVAPLPQGFNDVGQGLFLGVPNLIFYAVVLGIVFHLLLAKTRFGYDVQTVGGNEFAALATGVRVRRVRATVYLLSGAISALAGILYTARTGTGDPLAGGADLTFNVITAVLIGGTSLFGGIGSIAGTAMGSILFAVIQNGLTVAGVNPMYSNVIIGSILAAAVALDSWRRSQAFAVGRGR
jgi:ribose transport system permease protein